MQLQRTPEVHQTALTVKPLKGWGYILLSSILLYEGAGGLTGGILLAIAPDGHLMKMPVSLMHGVFTSFIIPAIILTGLGALNLLALMTLLRKKSASWLLTNLAMHGYAIWFYVEIIILQEVHWLHFMWGLPVLAGVIISYRMIPSVQKINKYFVFAGLASSVYYILLNIVVPVKSATYEVSSQTISELSAVGASTQLTWNLASVPYTWMIILFAIGIIRCGKNDRSLLLAGRFMLLYGVLGLAWPFAPMHLRETLVEGGATVSDTIHLALGAATELIYLVILIILSSRFGNLFRLYSAFTFICIIVFGILTFREAPGIAMDLPTPLIGIWERINIAVFMAWISTVSLILFKKENTYAAEVINV